MSPVLPREPELTPQFCFSPTALRDFLRLSRSAVDDSISQNLNALVTPSRAGFDPLSTSRGTIHTPYSRQIARQPCADFQSRVLFPSWHARNVVLDYCERVASSPDPTDTEVALRDAENERARTRIINERRDPYSARYFPREPRAERLAASIQQERGVERIVRERTWKVLQERCPQDFDKWEEALDHWRREFPPR